MRPVGAELEFHGNAGHNTEYEIDAKDLSPEAGRLAVDEIFTTQSDGLEHDNQQRQSHGELRKEIMEGRSESEVEAMNEKRAVHRSGLSRSGLSCQVSGLSCQVSGAKAPLLNFQLSSNVELGLHKLEYDICLTPAFFSARRFGASNLPAVLG